MLTLTESLKDDPVDWNAYSTVYDLMCESNPAYRSSSA